MWDITDIVYAHTGNVGKLRTLELAVRDLEVEIQQLSIPHYVEPDLSSVEAIARHKAERGYDHIRMYPQTYDGSEAIGIDAGFYIEGFDNWPGTNVNPALKEFGIEGILKRAWQRTISTEYPHCRIPNGVAVTDENGTRYLEFVLEGTLAEEPRGTFDPATHWSRLATIVVPKGEERTLAELSEEEYHEKNLGTHPLRGGFRMLPSLLGSTSW